MATPHKLWETNVGLRPVTHIMSTFVCLAIEQNKTYEPMDKLRYLRIEIGRHCTFVELVRL